MLNESQQKFVAATLRGATPKEAAIAAGLAEGSARNAGARMRRHPKVVAALAAVGIGTAPPPTTNVAATAAASAADMQLVDNLPRTEDAQEFLIALMNDPKAGIKARLEAAKALQPFQHAKIGEKGKKATKAEGAANAAAEGQKFGARPAPLKAVPK